MQRPGYFTYYEIAELLNISVEQARRIFPDMHEKFPGDTKYYVSASNVMPVYIKRIMMPKLYSAMDYFFKTGKATPQTINQILEIAGVDIEDRPGLARFLEDSAKEKGIFEED